LVISICKFIRNKSEPLQFPSLRKLLNYPLRHPTEPSIKTSSPGYYFLRESEGDTIVVGCVVVVVRVAVVVDIHKVGGVRGIRGTLPPVVRANPTRHRNLPYHKV
jgi:hypothetical protein